MYCVGCKTVCDWMHSVTFTPNTLSHSFRFWILFSSICLATLIHSIQSCVWKSLNRMWLWLAICLQSTNYAPNLTIYSKWIPFKRHKKNSSILPEMRAVVREGKDYSRGLGMFFCCISFSLVEAWKIWHWQAVAQKPAQQQNSPRKKFFHQRKLGKVLFFPHYLI